MQPPTQSYSCPPLWAVLLCVSLARSAPLQSNTYVLPLPWNNVVGTFGFPEQQEQSQFKIPQPRALSVSVEDASGDSAQAEDDLQQVLWLTSGLIPAQIVQRSQGRNNEGRFFGRGGSTVVVVTGGSGDVSNTNNSTFVSPAAAAAPATTTTGTRTSEFIRAPIAYPAMQYFRKRQDDGSSLSYPELFGWNAASFYGDDLGLSGGPNGGYSLPGVPLVPITVGNEVRYVPLNLRMYRQFVGDAPSLAPATLPAIREQDDQLEDDDISALAMGADLEILNESPNEANGGQEVASSGHSVVDSSGFGILGQRLRPRPLARRRPLQTLAQNIRRVQYLTQ
ncbi:uncharacterized protein LOC6550680 [Drosophila erecta]|uniref:Uncharacterized protein n=1 Tax=Drosophila erecta TaxID=7220 RepID=B3NTX7_DROER|nr:uncharacterized protein LOC6550680 [Drosophila erecta]EDV45685.1 uncharacterized protein Dere_GG18602 [Drosophila erecta]